MGRDNEQAWNDPSIAEVYAKGGLLVAELAVFAEAWPALHGGRVLDLGVGGGRTLPFLRGPAKSYIGLDYAQAMVNVCKRRFPDADVRCGDARELAGIPAESLDLVYFSYNSIDCIPVEDRPKVFAAARRVLAPGGYFGFSSHNLRTVGEVPTRFAPPEIDWSANPLRMAARLTRAAGEAARSYKNHLRLLGEQRRGEGFAVVNDGAHEFSMLFVYADPSWEVSELERAGFQDVVVFDERGRRADHATVTDPWVHYLCKKPAAG